MPCALCALKRYLMTSFVIGPTGSGVITRLHDCNACSNPRVKHTKDLQYQIELLEMMSHDWAAMGKDTQPVQTALLQLNAELAQVMTTMALAQYRAIHMWDEAKIAAGSFGDRVHAVMNELVIQGHQAGAEITKAFLTAIDGVETQFAKLLTGQKANFKQVFQSLAEGFVGPIG
jgi:hypothetical protein